MNLFKSDINKKGSASWLLCNDNSKSTWFRSKFIEKFGGVFNKTGRYWDWSDTLVPTSPPANTQPNQLIYITDIPKPQWIFEDESGIQHITDNLTDFSKKNSLSRQKLYDLMKGTRKTHKGLKFVSKTDPENLAT